MTFHRLATRADLFDGYKQAFSVNGAAVLLVQTEGKIYAVENKCGHFGIPLDPGRVVGARIRCSQHGAEFDLSSGVVTNHVVAQCDPLRTFVVAVRGEDVGVEL
jgi:nitrite reductase/ring-hydroxylating ferredoxin subunit